MRKFKLIKKYPQCRYNIGDVITFKNEWKEFFISVNECEKYPENWEEVSINKKEFEILSFKRIKEHPMCYSKVGDIIENESNEDFDPIYEDTIIIYSVKRISDGTVFTINDKIIARNRTVGFIKNFKIIGESFIKVFFDVESGNTISYIYQLSDIELVKNSIKPLFKTNDGVEIFKEDKCYYFNDLHLEYIIKSHDYINNFLDRRLDVWKGIDNQGKYFKQKNNAFNYILNKLPKDYKILSLYKGSNITSKKEDIEAWEKGFKSGYKIYSIKRLSDNQLFKIGTKIYFKNSPTKKIIGKITKFEISFKYLICYVDNLRLCLCDNLDKRNDILPIIEKSPLFITKDDIKIYEGDSYFLVTDDFNISRLKAGLFKMNSSTTTVFGYEKNANNYVLKNKPCLSYNDIMKLAEPYHKGNIKGEKAPQLTYKFKTKALLNFITKKINNE